MKICFLSIEFTPSFSGNGIYAVSQVRALRALGHEILVISGYPQTSALPPGPGLIQVPLSCWGSLTNCAWQEYAAGAAAPHTIKAIIDLDPDVILGVDWHSAPAYESIVQALMALHCPCPPFAFANYRVFHRSAQDEGEKALFRSIEGLALRHSICTTVLSRSDAQYVEENFAACLPACAGHPPRPTTQTQTDPGTSQKSTPLGVHVLLPALRSDMEILPVPSDDSPRRYLLCCVRASPEKEPARFVNLVCELQQRGVLEALGITPLVLGSGWESPANAELRQRLESTVPMSQVIEGFLGPEELAKIYRATVLNIHPPVYDAFGMTVVEAASQGAPTLVDAGLHVGATDLLQPTAGQILCTDFTTGIRDLADTVQSLLQNPGKLRSVGQAAMHASRQWIETVNAATLVSLLESSLAQEAEIEERTAEELSVAEFTAQYLARLRPVVITGVATDWAATKEWVLPSEEGVGGVDIDALEAAFGDSIVPVMEVPISKTVHHDMVAQTTNAEREEHNERQEEEGCGQGVSHDMTVSQYCSWWRQYKSQNQLHDPSLSTHTPTDGPLLYLKDWHFVNAHPEFTAYTCPPYFQDDWLNEWYDAQHQTSATDPDQTVISVIKNTQGAPCSLTTSDYRFFYLGPEGTHTPLHADVLRSHSWSVNVAGIKRWKFLHPRHMHLLRDVRGTTTAPDFGVDIPGKYPGLEAARQLVFEVLQGPGSAMFVPSGWWHTVENVTDALSINHNWMEGHSVRSTWEYLKAERSTAERLLEDCRRICEFNEFSGLVERNTATNAGLGYTHLGTLLRFIIQGALEAFVAPPTPSCTELNSGSLSAKAARCRLIKAGDVLEELLQEEQRLSAGGFYDEEIEANVASLELVNNALQSQHREN